MFGLTVSFRPSRRISMLAATVALSAAGATLGAGTASAVPIRPANSSGLLGQTVTVQVPASTGPTSTDMPGVDTGIDLAAGEAAMITATGTASCNGTDPIDQCVYLNANGGGSTAGSQPPFMDPAAPAFSLDGEVGSGPLTFIGTGPVTVQGPGELRLGYNDAVGYYAGNGGGFTATIQTCSLYGLPILGPALCSLLG